MSFYTATNAELLYTLPAAVTKNTYTTEAVFSAVAGTTPVCLLPGNYFIDNPNPVGRSLYLVARGIIANTAAATFAVNLGFDTTAGTKANNVAVMAATAPVATFTAPFTFEAWMTCTAFASTTMTLQINGTWAMEGANSAGAAVATALRTSFQTSLTTLVPSTSYYIELFGTWSASSASNTTTLHQMLLWGLN